MRDEDLKILEQQDGATLAKWWCLLNRYEWPELLPEPVAGFQRDRTHPSRVRVRQIMEWIDDRVGHRRVSREWNRDMTDDEFEDFWRGEYEGHAASKARYRERLERQCRAELESQ